MTTPTTLLGNPLLTNPAPPWRKPSTMHTIQDVERERQRPFAQLLADLAEEGLSMRKAAIVLDVNREAVRRYVEKLGDASPFDDRWIAQAWLHKTGETVAQTARRLADTHTLIQVATLIGYGDGRALRKALIARNVHVKFVPDPWNSARWPSKSA